MNGRREKMEKLIACRSKGVGREWGREEGERVKRKNQKTTLEKGFFIQHFKNILIPTKRSTDRIEGSKQGDVWWPATRRRFFSSMFISCWVLK